MSEPDSPTRGDLHHQQLRQSATQPNADERDDANNSIIGKVKSRVSSIFPQQLTKWFSPSSSASVLNTSTSNGGLGRRRRRNDERGDDHERADNSDEDSNNSGEDEEPTSPTSAQPPTKRSRLNVEATRTHFKEVGQNILSSTPTTGARRRITHMNLYEKQREPAYSFGQSIIKTTTTTTAAKTSAVDSTDIIEVVPDRNVLNTSISSRRSLNIPSTTSTESHRSLNDFKRRSVLSVRTSGTGNSSYLTQPSSTIAEVNVEDDDDDNEDNAGQEASGQTIEEQEDDIEVEEDDDNEESEEIAKVTSKKPKFTNGNRIGRSSSIATESGESRSSSVQAQTTQQKSGLFNHANRSLRTMSGNGLNFYSHLEGPKSLFSEKNMPGTLNNSTLSLTSLNRRQFNSSIYGSTSALSDSRLLNTSSPFYKGQTTYGGAAAYSKFNRNINQSVRIAPTLIRPTSSLSTLSSSTNSLAQGNDLTNSTAISSTAKRILELINDFSTPLNDAKKMAGNIKTPAMLANRNATGKRFSETDLASTRSVRLSSVRKPYTRPTVTLNPSNDSKKLLPPLKELQVPSMSQLLQMKKMQNCTERSRQIANTSKSAFNRECEYKLPVEDNATASIDKSNNKHVSKIKNKVTATSRVSSKNVHAEDEEPPAPANLPNIAFPFMQSVPKIDIAVKGNKTTASSPPPPKADFKFAVSAEAKPTNNFTFGSASSETKSLEKSHVMNFNSGKSTSISTPPKSTSALASVEYKFSSPLSLSCTPSKGDLAPINNFKFSSPLMVGQKEVEKVQSLPSTNQLKTGSVLDALKKPIEKSAANVAPTPAPLFGAQFKKPSNEWECSECMVRNKDTVDKCVACTTPRNKPVVKSAPALSLSNSLGVKNTFGEAFKPKSDTWECSACMVRNKNEVNECVACSTKRAGAAEVAPTATTKLQTTDDGFKSLVAKQTASKWECDACMTRNDAERNKCVCCEQAKPGTQVVSESVPKFSFGASSASKFTFGFGGAAGAKKEDELKAESASKTENKAGFTFGVPAKTTETAVSTTGFSFGIKPQQDTKAPTSEDVPDVVKTNITPGFKFGIQQADSNKSESATTKPTTGFSFGLKPAEPKAAQNVTFSLPSTTTSSILPTTSSSAVTSTSSTISSPFNASTSSVFGVVKKTEETKPTESKGFVFGTPTAVSSNATPAAAVKPLTFSTPSDATNAAPKTTFGIPSSVASSVSTSTPSSGFGFGKPAVTTTSAMFTSKPTVTQSPGFGFGKDQSSGSTSPFGSSASLSSSTSGAASKSPRHIFGTVAAAPTTAAVSSSTTGFDFGKPAPSPFGKATSSSTAGTASIFGSKPAVPLFAAPTSTLSTPTSTISSTALVTNPSQPVSSQSSPFVFGSGSAASSNTNSKPLFGGSSFETRSTAAASTTTSSSWPTNTFTFGAAKPPEEVKPNIASAFGTPASIFGQITPMFGSTQQQVNEVKPLAAAAPTTIPAFGASSANSPFGSSTTATPGAGVATNNVFGSTSSAPIFGSTMGFESGFGGSSATAAPAAPANSSNNQGTMPTFGSSSFSSGFGSIAASSAGSGSNDGGPAPKKADTAFNFGGAQSSSSGGFSFGGNNNKPAPEAVFKFSTSSAPSFNFTGATESTNVAQPFQFGAPTNTPAVFNFGGVEGSNSGGPFQFNAAAPAAATNNIFAPMPTPGLAGSQQATRRKMRTVTRRTQPR